MTEICGKKIEITRQYKVKSKTENIHLSLYVFFFLFFLLNHMLQM